MKKRNYNVDILRALATLLIVLYHCWVKCGQTELFHPVVTLIVMLGGEIGVTAFFALSGYGIFCSLKNTDENGEIHFIAFFKKRMQRILPQYLVCLLLCYAIMGNDLFNIANIKNLVTHLLFIHNLFPAYSGAINGVLWTMGTIVQFYVIAIPLYYAIKKWKYKTAAVSIFITVVSKVIIYNWLTTSGLVETTSLFFAGRQLLTALDNFVVGMVVAQYLSEHDEEWKTPKALVVLFIGIILLLAECKVGQTYGIWTNNSSGYVWHSVIVICLAIICIGFSKIRISKENIITKIFLWIAKYEYGIYIWHLLIIDSILGASAWINNQLAIGHNWMVYFILMVISIVVGVYMSIGFDHIKKEK